MKRTFVLVEGEFVERKRDKRGRYHDVMPDIQPDKSMIDGRMITSRSEHRAHLKANNCVEVGNDDPSKHIRREQRSDERTKRLAYEVNKRLSNAQADQLMRKLRQDLNFTNPHRRG